MLNLSLRASASIFNRAAQSGLYFPTIHSLTVDLARFAALASADWLPKPSLLAAVFKCDISISSCICCSYVVSQAMRKREQCQVGDANIYFRYVLTVAVRLYDTDPISNAQGATQMSSFPCITSFRTPHDLPGPYDHCTGQFNVSLGGVEWTVDFDYNEPIVYVGAADVTDCLKNSTLTEILENARKQHDEVDA